MGPSQEVDDIKTLQAVWLDAMRAADIDRLLSMVTDDIVVAHPGGKTTHGKQELADDFQRFFRKFRTDQSADSEETVVAGEWAFDRARVRTRVVPIAGGEPSQVNSEVILILRRDREGWKIARTMSVLR